MKEDLEIPLCFDDTNGRSDHSYSHNVRYDFPRTGTLWTAVAHIITAVIGAGVLSLAWSIAQLGWIAGPAAMIAFAVVTYYTSCLLADFYRSPDPVTGNRNYTYKDAVRVTLGEKQEWLCGLLQYVNLYGTGIAYTITASISMRAIGRSNCFHKEGQHAPCHFSEYPFMVFFGITEIFLSQIPDFAEIWWLSIVAAIMSVSYATIGLGLGIAKVIGIIASCSVSRFYFVFLCAITSLPSFSYSLYEHGRIYGSLGGISSSSKAQKVWQVFQALGDIAFAYSYSMVLIEIEDTLNSPPPENKTMKKATLFSVIATTVFYMLCGCFGYAAFGENVPGNLLTGFGFYEPYWLIDFANACIVVHLVGAYQVFSQPLFAFIEGWFSHKWPNNGFINNNYGMHIPCFGLYNLNLFRLCWRTAFVVSTTGISMLLPFFNYIIGILGAVTFWPVAVYFPVGMYIARNKIQCWTLNWILLQAFSFICFLVSLAAAVGSIEGLLEGEQS